MGKVKKSKVSKGEISLPKVGLAKQIEDDNVAKMKNRNKIRHRTVDDEEVISSFLTFL